MSSNFNNVYSRLENECFSLKPNRVDEIFPSYQNLFKSFSIISQNIRSFNRNFDDFSVFFDDYTNKIDIMVFSETWFESDNCSSIQSYDDYHTVRQNKKGGGVSIYVRNKYKSSKLNNLSGIYSTFEACTVILKVNESFEIYIVCLYRPPDSSLNQFFLDFLRLI